MKKKFGIYIHWPFCLSKCPYCDFFSQVRKDISQDDIIKEYLSDLDFYHEMTSHQKVTSIFFGGGTPSLIKPQNIEKIISYIKRRWNYTDDIEISLEANPNTNHPTLFTDIKNAGINRLSLGVQSLNDDDLRFLGRTHNTKEAIKAINEVLKIFSNHSIDVIYSLPHQEIKSWVDDLEKITNFGFKHLSLYQLMIEEGTVFHKNGTKTMDQDKSQEMYNLTTNILMEKGYNRYEISNFSQKDFECRHNLIYWEGYDYIGIGKSSHGRIGLTATTHQKKLEKLTPEERAEELVIMGMRLKSGINKKRFKSICGLDFDNFINLKGIEDLIINTKDNIKASTKGFLLLDSIINHMLT